MIWGLLPATGFEALKDRSHASHAGKERCGGSWGLLAALRLIWSLDSCVRTNSPSLAPSNLMGFSRSSPLWLGLLFPVQPGVLGWLFCCECVCAVCVWMVWRMCVLCVCVCGTLRMALWFLLPQFVWVGTATGRGFSLALPLAHSACVKAWGPGQSSLLIAQATP